MSDEAQTPQTPAPAPAAAPKAALSPEALGDLRALLEREKSAREAQKPAASAPVEPPAETERRPASSRKVDTSASEELSAIKAELASIKAQSEKTEYQRAYEEERAQVRATLGEDYPAIDALKAHDYVLETQLQEYKRTGEWMETAKAAAQVEDRLYEFVEKLLPVVEARRRVKRAAPEPEPEQQTLSSRSSNETPRRHVAKRYDPVALNEEMLEFLR